MAKRKKPKVKLDVQTTSYPDVVRIEIEISGADAAARSLAEMAIKMALDGLEGELVTPHLPRSTFATSRLAEFASVKELTTQTGHGPEDWPLVIIKELTDNGIDAAEARGVAPVIAIKVTGNSISVTDNGGGIAPDDVTRMLDYTQRISSNEAHASPTRGRQGNAIQTVLAMPFVLDGKRGETVIESRGVKHTIIFEIDPIRQTPKLAHAQAKGRFVHSGTGITVQWPESVA